MNQRWIHFFGETWPDDAPTEEARARLGGKGASLDAMTHAGFPVPPGFTILTAACRWFFEHDETWPPDLADELRAAIARLEELTGREFGGDTAPLLVAVRSGAVVSMPGMMDTILNVGVCSSRREEAPFDNSEIRIPKSEIDQSLRTSPATGSAETSAAWDELTAAINAVFRSWHSERAVAWRANHPAEANGAGTAVNIQAMVPAEISGVVFTRNPQQLLAPHLVIEAVRGLGTALVSGEVTPEHVVLSRENFHCFIGGPPRPGAALSPGDASHLARLALRVEAHFGSPQDIEWAQAEGRLWLLQSRPIRGWLEACRAENTRLEIITRLRSEMKGSRRIWVAHNLGETLRFPTPLTWGLMRHFMSGDGGFGRMYERLGYQPSDEVRRDGFLALISGRIYADPERLAQLFWADLPLRYDLARVARDPLALQGAPTRIDPEKADGALLFRLPSAVRSLWRSAQKMSAQRSDAARHFEEDVLPPYLDWLIARRADNLTALSPAQLVDEFERRRARVLDDFGSESLLPAFFGGLAVSALESSLGNLMGPHLAAQTVQELTAALPGEVGADQESLLERVARGEASLDEFLDQFGHRAAGEMELMTPRWREQPGEIKALLASLRGGGSAERRHCPPTTMSALSRDTATTWPSVRRAQAAARRAEAEQRLPQLLAEWGGSSEEKQIMSQLREAQALLPYRERSRHGLMAGYELLRAVALELGRRWNLGDDVFFLEPGELRRFETERERLLPVIVRRKEEREDWRRIDLPELIDEAWLSRLGQASPPPLPKGDWHGAPLAAGCADGCIFVAPDTVSTQEFPDGGVLVCPSTDPGWLPLLLRARALVVERGGLLSHGAIVARDLGLPAVVLPEATRLLPSGQAVRVDGHSGAISLVKEAAHV